jgi:type I restriction enzyme S subunit
MTGEIGSTDVQEKRELPAGWRWVKLGEVCERIDYGYTASALREIEYPKFLRITDIQDGKVCWGKVPGCDISLTSESDYALCHGDIVFARTGATTGKSFLIINPPRAIFASYLIRLRLLSQHVLFDFLALYFLSDEYWRQVSSGMRGGAQGGFNASMLKKLEIPLPPLPEQQRIAALLKEQMAVVDKARAAAEERLAAIKALPAAFLRQVFPEPDQPLPAGWHWVKLGDMCDVVSKGTTPSSLGLSYSSEGIPFLRAEDINGTVVDPSKVAFHISSQTNNVLDRSQLFPGDFLITIAGTLGRVGYIADGMPAMNCNQAVAFARPRKYLVSVEYMVYVCQNHDVLAPLLNQRAGGALQNLNLQQVRALRIPLPPLPEQQRIAALLKEQMAAVDKARKAAEAELETINTLPAALLRRAFNGEL